MAITIEDKNLGHATAYAYAKSKGYAGTEEEFAEDLKKSAEYADNAAASATSASESATNAANSATAAGNAQTAAESAKTAAQSAQTAAESAKTSAQSSATSAGNSATAASGSASNASAFASSAASSASSASSSASSASASATAAGNSATSAGTSATNAAGSATSAASSATAAQTARTGAETAQGKAETAQGKAEDAAESVEASAAQIATNTQDISDLKSSLNIIGIAFEIVDFTEYDVINGTMQASGKWAGFNGDTYQSTLVTAVAYNIKVTAQNTHNAYISFFNKVPTQPASETQQVYFCEGETGRHMINAGTSEEFEVPEDCKCVVVTTKSGGTDYTPQISGQFKSYGVIDDLFNEINTIKDDIYSVTYSKTAAYAKFNVLSDKTTNVWIGQSYSEVITGVTGAVLVEIPCSKYSSIDYPALKTTQGKGSIFLNDNDIVIGGLANTTVPTGDPLHIDVPEGAVKFILNISASIASTEWSVTLNKPDIIELNRKVEDLQNGVSMFSDENRNMCLAGIKTDILTNKIPYHRGFLFHKLQNNDNSLWYGTDFNNINKIGVVSFDPTLMRFAISPKDGRVIAVQRDTRNGIWIWDGETETHLDSFTLNPMAWLYNSGVDFINDGTDEYCIFAEYKGGAPFDSFNVWRGKYPYTSASDWEIVFTQTPTDITHFHMVRRDPWTNILYLTAGDSSPQSKWWYSTDSGATWTLLVSGTDTGWDNSLCRTINFVFTEDYVYWATDHGESSAEHHTLNRIQRDGSTGVLDLTTKEQLALLPKLYATNSLCYVESPNGLFMYDRIDTASSSVFGEPIKMMFWDFASEQLVEIASLKLTSDTWGGSRGKCYINYTNGKQPMPAMGFSIDTPCIFDLVCDNPSNIGTIAYDVGSKTIRTIDY